MIPIFLHVGCFNRQQETIISPNGKICRIMDQGQGCYNETDLDLLAVLEAN